MTLINQTCLEDWFPIEVLFCSQIDYHVYYKGYETIIKNGIYVVWLQVKIAASSFIPKGPWCLNHKFTFWWHIMTHHYLLLTCVSTSPAFADVFLEVLEAWADVWS